MSLKLEPLVTSNLGRPTDPDGFRLAVSYLESGGISAGASADISVYVQRDGDCPQSPDASVQLSRARRLQ